MSALVSHGNNMLQLGCAHTIHPVSARRRWHACPSLQLDVVVLFWFFLNKEMKNLCDFKFRLRNAQNSAVTDASSTWLRSFSRLSVATTAPENWLNCPGSCDRLAR